MLIALPALLGVDLIILVVLAAFVFTRKCWVNQQPGAFRGAIGVAGGQVDGLKPTWHRGYGHGEDAERLLGLYRTAGATLGAASTSIAAAASREEH